jgi:hypothetical protein
MARGSESDLEIGAVWDEIWNGEREKPANRVSGTTRAPPDILDSYPFSCVLHFQ